jgi:hypothetical protein
VTRLAAGLAACTLAIGAAAQPWPARPVRRVPHVISPSLYKTLPYDPLKDFAPALLGPLELGAFLRAEHEKWDRVVRATGATVN